MLPDAELPESGRLILTNEGDIFGRDTEENRQLARRVQACINACEGISTEELERGLVADMARVIEQLAPLIQAASTRAA